MPRSRTDRLVRRSLVALTSAGLVLGTCIVAQAADDEGVGGLLQRLFAPAPSSPPVPVALSPQPSGQAGPDQAGWPSSKFPDARGAGKRRAAGRLRPNIRYASLPKPGPEALRIRITDRQTPIDLANGPTAAFLKDRTLRPGDIVVLKDGARVFAGDPEKPHAVRDFEGIGRSSFVDRHARALLTAMLVPGEALPAAEARKVMARSRTMPPLPVSTQVTAPQVMATRVIYPWKTTP